MKSAILITLVFAVSALSATAQLLSPPALIDYQGQLLNSVGGPLTSLDANPGTAANFQIHFRIWDEQSNGTLIWAEKQVVTVNEQGFFSVRLGEGEAITDNDVNPNASPPSVPNSQNALLLAFAGDQRYLGVTVLNPPATPGEIQPRLRFLSAPFAVVAQKAVIAESGPSSGPFKADQVGIGTTTPNTPFHNSGASTFGAGFAPNGNNDNNLINILAGTTNGFENGISFYEDTTGNAIKLGYDGSGSGAGNALRFYDFSNNSIFSVEQGGDVGIGIDDPEVKLHVVDAADTAIARFSGASSQLQVESKTSMIELVGREDAGSNFQAIHLRASSGTGLLVEETGDVGVNTTDPQVRLHVNDSADASLGDGAGVLMIGNQDGANLLMDTNEVMARSNGAGVDLYLNDGGGDVRVGGAGTSNLLVDGDIRLGPNRQYHAPAGEERLRMLRGNINSSGTISAGSGFTVSRTGTGNYLVSFSSSFSGTPTVTCSPLGAGTAASDNFFVVESITASNCRIKIYDDNGTETANSLQDTAFTFIAIGPR